MTKAEIMEVLNITEEQINMLIAINDGNAVKVMADLEKMAEAYMKNNK